MFSVSGARFKVEMRLRILRDSKSNAALGVFGFLGFRVSGFRAIGFRVSASLGY